MKQAFILIGLPASGKTHTAKEMGLPVFPLDKKGVERLKTFPLKNEIVIDGLITTKKQQEKIVSILNARGFELFTFIFFKEDKIQCLKNDRYRGRPLSAQADITALSLDFVSLNQLAMKFPKAFFSYQEKEVWKCPEEPSDSELKLPSSAAKALMRNEKLRSKEWQTGGVRGNCYDDEKYVLEAEYFSQTDWINGELLQLGLPAIINLSLFDKLVNRGLMIQEEYSEHGYYGTRIDYAYWEISIDKLISFLKEENII